MEWYPETAGKSHKFTKQVQQETGSIAISIDSIYTVPEFYPIHVEDLKSNKSTLIMNMRYEFTLVYDNG